MYNSETVVNQLAKIVSELEDVTVQIMSDRFVIYVDENLKPQFISYRDALSVIDKMENSCASEPIGKLDFLIIYDKKNCLNLEGEKYVPGGYLIMKSEYGLKDMTEQEFDQVYPELLYHLDTVVCGKYRFKAYRLDY